MCAGRHRVMSCYVVRRGGVETGQAFLKELREFLRFLRSLWGILAGISVLFPLSNVVVTVIPIGDGGKPFQNLSPNVVTAITMVTCIFLIFATFSRRSEFTQRRRRTRYALSAGVSFLVALGTLAAYVLAPHESAKLWGAELPRVWRLSEHAAELCPLRQPSSDARQGCALRP